MPGYSKPFEELFQELWSLMSSGKNLRTKIGITDNLIEKMKDSPEMNHLRLGTWLEGIKIGLRSQPPLVHEIEAAEFFIDQLSKEKNKPKLIMVDCEPKSKLQIKKRTFFNLNWNEQDYNLKYNREDVPKPSNLKQMISVAEKICSNFDFIRVDIFTDGTKCLVGEITNIHANASQRFIPLSGEKTASETIFN